MQITEGVNGKAMMRQNYNKIQTTLTGQILVALYR